MHICVCVCVRTHAHAMEYYSAIKKNGILSLVMIWKDLEGVMLSEVQSDRERQLPYDFTYMWTLKNKTNK